MTCTNPECVEERGGWKYLLYREQDSRKGRDKRLLFLLETGLAAISDGRAHVNVTRERLEDVIAILRADVEKDRLYE